MKKTLLFIFSLASFFFFYVIAGCPMELDSLDPDDNPTITNDTQAPTITNQVFSVTNAINGTVVGTIKATDNVGVVSYAIRAGDTNNVFAISNSGSNGVLTTRTNLTMSNVYTLTVEIADAASNTASNVITVNVTVSGEETNCFIAGTMIFTPQGERAIESLQVGDWVFSYDHAADKIISNQITAIKKSTAKNTLRVTLTNGSIFECTPEHPFYLAKKGDYVTAENLKIGDSLLDNTKRLKEVVEIGSFSYPSAVAVYDLTVGTPHHNFFAGGVLVHNKTPITIGGFFKSVTENAPIGTVIITLSGSYFSLNNPEMVSFDIISGNHDNAFSLSNDGKLYLEKALNYHEVIQYFLSVEGIDIDDKTYEITVIIDVTLSEEE